MAEQDRPWTWKVPEASEGIKRSMTRQDGFDRVSGHAVFTRDICLPGMPYAKILISPFAHAKIDGINLEDHQRKTLQRGGTFGRYLPSGHLVYINKGTLFGVPFDLDCL